MDYQAVAIPATEKETARMEPLSHWILAAHQKAKDLIASTARLAADMHEKYPDIPIRRWQEWGRADVLRDALAQILGQPNLRQIRAIALSALLATTLYRSQRQRALCHAGFAFACDHKECIKERAAHLDSIQAATQGRGCGDWEEIVFLMLEEDYVEPGSRAEHLLVEELVLIHHGGNLPERVAKILEARGVHFCGNCTKLTAPIKTCDCLSCSICGAENLQEDEVPADEPPFSLADDEMWESIQAKHKPECSWAGSRGRLTVTMPR